MPEVHGPLHREGLVAAPQIAERTRKVPLPGPKKSLLRYRGKASAELAPLIFCAVWASKFVAVLRNPFSGPKNLELQPAKLVTPKSPVSNTSARRGTAQSQSVSDTAAHRGAPE